MIEAAIVEVLSNSGPWAAFAGARIYPLLIPEHAEGQAPKFPCAVYQRSGTQRAFRSCDPDALVRAQIQIDVYALSYGEAKLGADLARAALLDFTGEASGMHIDGVSLESELDALDPEPGLYRVSQTYDVRFLE